MKKYKEYNEFLKEAGYSENLPLKKTNFYAMVLRGEVPVIEVCPTYQEAEKLTKYIMPVVDKNIDERRREMAEKNKEAEVEAKKQYKVYLFKELDHNFSIEQFEYLFDLTRKSEHLTYEFPDYLQECLDDYVKFLKI